ncbi:hypothetical protein PR202_gb21323 [Eleusine coracana subsp. coracana]|uniref:GDSL esterase/lipase n=1 Tax=Eleusine coracana subsp. coracana TaxID=191504 RepID=A0AAV5FD42_ELECO|nr:hypothetical protein QOZ80_7BG0604800 [Eleusine coracana subsp. coracana]GJN32793.1 hypothetical protein PR202_gb21323 [Eleusine coracana subsp. coracana]
MKTLCFVICILFLLHAAAHVESRHHRDDREKQPSYKLFVFGDTFVDNGNTDKEELTQWTRNWYSPYGVSDSNHRRKPTGRFSDGKVQSDFIAMLLGHDESPPPENLTQNDVDPFGMNFAVAFAGVTGRLHPPNLGTQVGRFRRMLNNGIIDKDMKQSVALVAFSGYDYADMPDDHDDLVEFIEKVTDGIVNGVEEILRLGVNKVLVNMMHPMGCTPTYTRTTTDYTECIKDNVTDIHNRMLKKKLGSSKDSVLLLDLNNEFTTIINSKKGTGFLHRHIPCCVSDEEDGYCGQVDEFGVQQFQVCDEPGKYFYFDDWHPTQAGWKAVIDNLAGDIKEFLDISS